MELVTSSFGGPVLRQISTLFGESEAGTHAAVSSAVPTLLASALQKIGMPGGASELMRTITSDTVDSGIAGALPGLVGSQAGVNQLLARGEPLANSLLGTRAGGVTHAIAETSGLKPSSVTALLSMAAPLLFGFLKKFVSQGKLDAGGLSNLLLSQRGALEKTGLDSRITSALGFGSLSSLLGSIPGASAFSGAAASASGALQSGASTLTPAAQTRKWIPWAVAAGVAIVALLLWNSFSARRATERTVASANSALDDTATRLQTAGLPAKVYFETGAANLTSGDRVKLAAVASTIRTSGGTVAVTGYTDRTGSSDQNLALAKDRATAVRDVLVSEGVSETSIVMAPPAFVTGTGPDEEARRVEITSNR